MFHLADPNDLILRVYRAESLAALFEFGKALKELDFILSKRHNWPEVTILIVLFL